MDLHLDSLLNLPNVTVLSCQQQEGLIFLSLDFFNEGILCPHCQTYTDNLHQTRPILVRDLSIPLEWIETRRNYTKGYEEYIYEKVKELPSAFDNSRNTRFGLDSE